ncbi:hypothetical protein AV654_16620 [Paenibacillus elgii]|uniref:Beta-ketoacyl-[acyl-carrier-protein] synthase III C-terminal domain-containing protein n=2 Tax=Paenibacillus elgii TaxID=189691 RepID=A0A163YA42_9BACL|nr:hypothetical protein AV654_16620 [Paenibacillus elgii]
MPCININAEGEVGMTVYLSSPDIAVPADRDVPSQASGPAADPAIGYAEALHHIEGVPLPDAAGNSCAGIPAFQGSVAELTAGLLAGAAAGHPAPAYLCWAHETSAPHPATLPAMQMAQALRLKAGLPFGVGQQGSLATVSAAELLVAFLGAEGKRYALLVAADCVKPPFGRRFHRAYPKGDAAACWVLSAEPPGDYRWAGTRYALCRPLAQPPFKWERWHFETAERQVTEAALRLAAGLRDGDVRRSWLVAQQVSAAFLQEIRNTVRQDGRIRLFERAAWSQANLLCADPLVSLRGLEESGELKRGDRVCLLFAGLDYGAAAIDLQYLKESGW